MKPIYLNTDLELGSRTDLGPLHAELVDAGLDGDLRWRGGVCTGSYNGPAHRMPHEVVERMLDVVEALSSESRELWDTCRHRRFIVGIGFSDEPFGWSHSAWTFPPASLLRLSNANGSLVWFVYRPDSFTKRKSVQP